MPNFSPLKLTCKGFTLSELLVSLAVLGVIAGIAVPSVLTSLKQSQDNALFGTTIRTLTEASSKLTNEPPALSAPNNTTWHAFDLFLNSADDNFVALNNPANSFTMPGGVVIDNFNQLAAAGFQTIRIDVNGAGQPNQIGRDRLMVTACFNPTGTCAAVANITVNSAAQEAGIVGPTPDTFDASTLGNVAFYNQLVSTT
ncbi:MAG: type II secretion system protein [Vampirovibrio sp.]|nr:type II secretion system protein [Vampirovibrio sp.]